MSLIKIFNANKFYQNTMKQLKLYFKNKPKKVPVVREKSKAELQYNRRLQYRFGIASLRLLLSDEGFKKDGYYYTKRKFLRYVDDLEGIYTEHDFRNIMTDFVDKLNSESRSRLLYILGLQFRAHYDEDSILRNLIYKSMRNLNEFYTGDRTGEREW